MNSEKPAPLRPEPVTPSETPGPVHQKSDMNEVVAGLMSGTFFLVKDAFPTGLKVLSELKKQVFGGRMSAPDEMGGEDFQGYRIRRAEFRQASNRLLVPVEQNRIALRKSPDIGWLRELYPEMQNFQLPFPQIQGLNSSWQWFLKGVRFPVLRHEIYPWYGTYFPTRFDHLLLFDEWLKKYRGKKHLAFDIGAGCGVLCFQLLKHGFRHIIATDINPNAVITVRENARHQSVQDRLEAHLSDLFKIWKDDDEAVHSTESVPETKAKSKRKTEAESRLIASVKTRKKSRVNDNVNAGKKADLIVFNPPWLPADEGTGMLDRAIYYEPGLFDRFFADAGDHLEEEGKLVVLFSNLGRMTGIGEEHPVEEELARFKRYMKVERIERKVVGPSRNIRRPDHRKGEFVELWVLEKH